MSLCESFLNHVPVNLWNLVPRNLVYNLPFGIRTDSNKMMKIVAVS